MGRKRSEKRKEEGRKEEEEREERKTEEMVNTFSCWHARLEVSGDVLAR